MEFLKKYGRLISNVLVVVAVILAIIVKWNESGEQSFFRETDAYIVAGAALGFLVLKLFVKDKNAGKPGKKSGKGIKGIEKN